MPRHTKLKNVKWFLQLTTSWPSCTSKVNVLKTMVEIIIILIFWLFKIILYYLLPDVNSVTSIKHLYLSILIYILSDEGMSKKKYEEMEDYLTDHLDIAHDLITRLRQLLTMEKTGAVMDHSLNRTRFFKMNDDYGKLIKTYRILLIYCGNN